VSFVQAHLDWYCSPPKVGCSTPSVFWNLHELKAGDEVYLDLSNGLRERWAVTGQKTYAYTDRVPLANGGAPQLDLSTCSGAWLQAQQVYAERLVIESKYEGAV
jgi:sortase (surface protein transpeptidase)